MRVPKLVTAGLAVTGVVAAVTTAGTGAGAATDTVPHFSGTAGGSYVTALGGRVTSGMTAQSTVDSLNPGASDSNQAASATVAGLIDVKAVASDISTSKTAGGYAMTAHAKTSGLSLLGGLITADAVDTHSTATLVNGKAVNDISTTFVNLKVAKVTLPVTIKKNTSVTIPGVARVSLDYGVSASNASGTATRGAGLVITLLEGMGNSPAKSVIMLNPVTASVGLVGSGFRVLGGYAYGTRADVTAGSSVKVLVGASGATSVPASGTGGGNVSNNSASANLAPLATAKVVGSTASGLATNGHSYASETVQVAGLNLLDGLITADALKGTARSEVINGGAPKTTVTTQLLNLKIAGRTIAANVSPNTTIDVAGLGTVSINVQVHNGGIAGAKLLDIKLSTAKAGLPVGAEIEVGTAVAYVTE